MKRTFVLLIAVVLSIAMILSACGNKENSNNAGNQSQAPQTGGESPAPKKDPAKVKVGLLKLTGSAPLFIAMEKGFFEEENLDVTFEWFEAAQPITVAAASGAVDVAAGGITASLYNMVAEGQKLQIVADKGREWPGYIQSAVMVHKDSGIESIKDLKGKKIGVTQTGSTFHYSAGRVLEKYGLSLSDVEIVPLGKLGAMNDTLKSRQVDAILTAEPNISLNVSEGYGKVLATVGDEIEYQIAAMIYSQKFAGNKDAAVRFMKVYSKATQYYYDAVLVKENGKAVPGQNYDEVINIIAKYTDQPKELIEKGLPYIDRDGRLLAEDIPNQIAWYLKTKMIEKEVDHKTIVNTEFLEEALKK